MNNVINTSSKKNRNFNGIKLVTYSLIGIFMFFVSITIGDKKTIPIDHIVTWIRKIPYFIPVYGGIMIAIGTIIPFINKTWNKNKTTTVFSLLGIVGLITAFMAIFNVGPAFLLEPNMVPYVFKIVVVPVIAIVPIGAVFLAFLVDYGLMEFIGVFMRPVMRPIWKTPGRSAIDAVASFVGSYSLALLVTNRVYKEGKYNTREASIIATGFSTVSATFMIIVASTLGIMEHWSAFFWITLVVTFVVTAITAQIYPLSKKPETYYNNVEPDLESEERGDIIKRAWEEEMKTMAKAPSLVENITNNLKDGIKLAINIGPNIMSIGVLALLAAEYTKIFDVVGYLFYPFTSLLRIPDPLLAAKASAITLADMYVPAIVAKGAEFSTRFIIAIVCISEILFLSASVPCILATDIPISIKDIVIIWFERVVLSLIIAAPIVYLVF
ncbi:YjiH family protein [Clostridium lundense]|uniref:YjiH family protein n=1 Tax=Clostridium lundense TaxID=319475 RepID=UPI0005532B5E|nr:YjiH family protein [Clostridium lundense]